MVHISRVADDILLPEVEIPFICDPLIPAQGVTLLHGPKGIGKSPFIWTLARSVASGMPFLGLPTTKGKVLVIEVDSPELTVQRRLRQIPDIPQEWFTLWGHAFNMMASGDPIRQALREAAETLNPQLVILNTLRKAHPGDDKESAVPSLFYRQFELLFPNAARMVVHHDRKPKADDDFPDHSQSGSEAWRNDAQSVIHLERRGGKGKLTMTHTGSQVSELLDSLPLHLICHNSLVALHDERNQIVWDIYQTAEGESGRQKAEAASITLKERGIDLSGERVRAIVRAWVESVEKANPDLTT